MPCIWRHPVPRLPLRRMNSCRREAFQAFGRLFAGSSHVVVPVIRRLAELSGSPWYQLRDIKHEGEARSVVSGERHVDALLQLSTSDGTAKGDDPPLLLVWIAYPVYP